MRKHYFKILLCCIFGIQSPSLNRKVKLKDLFNKRYLG